MPAFTGDDAANLILGTQDTDTLEGGAGNDTLNGGMGYDVALFSGNAADYRLTWHNGTLTVLDTKFLDGNDGADQLSGVEILRFADRDFKLGPITESRLNATTAGDQNQQSVATLADGSVVAVWSSFGQDGSLSGVVAQLFDRVGVASGPEVLVNNTTLGSQDSVSVAALSGGGFVVSWNADDADQEGVFARVFDATGTPLAGEFQVNVVSASGQFEPAVAGLASGGFVVTWFSDGQDGDRWGVFSRVFDASGNPQGATDIRVSQSTFNEQFSTAVSGLKSGGFAAVWTSYHENNEPNVYARVFDASGAPTGAEFRVNTTTVDNQDSASVSVLADGSFVVAWVSNGQDGAIEGVFARHFTAAGVPSSDEIAVNQTFVGAQILPSIIALQAGGYAVAWTSSGQDGSSGGTFARIFSSTDAAVTAEFPLNSTTLGNQTFPILSAGQENGLFATWQSEGQDGSGKGIFSIRLDGLGQTLAPRIVGTSGDDRINLNSSQTLQAEGGAGNDEYLASSMGNLLVERTGGGYDTVYALTSYTLGAALEELRLTGTAPLNGVGNLLANKILGNSSANVLSGSAGTDTLLGGAGNDTLGGGVGTDADSLSGGLGDDVYNVFTNDIVVELPGQGTDLVYSSASWTLGANIEALTLTGTSDIGGTGNILDNDVTGNAGANVLSGLAGSDSLFGAAGADTLFGGDGNDTLSGGAGSDVLRGGNGDDFYVFGTADTVIETIGAGYDVVQSAISTGVMAANVEELRLTGAGALTATGNSLGNLLIGNSGDNGLSGADGNDTVLGGGGADTLAGGLMSDFIIGGVGNDVLFGGSGADQFVFDSDILSAANADLIGDFGRRQGDKIVLDDDIFTAFDAVVSGTLTAGQLVATGSTMDASTRLVYDQTTGALYYDADGVGTAFSAVQFAQVGASVHPNQLLLSDFIIVT